MGADQVLLVVLAAAGAALAAALAVRLAMEERSRREIEEARRQLVAAASHDLRTPLASLRLLVESIDDGVATGETRDRYLGEIRTHVGVLSDLDRRPLRALADRGRRHLLDDAPGRARRPDRRHRRGDAGPGRASAASASPPSCRRASSSPSANAEKVQRVLFNLIQNAIRHTPADGSVTVRARSSRRRRRGRGRRRRRGDPGRRRRAGLRGLLPRRRRPRRGRRRPRPGDLPRDRRGPRGQDLARRRVARDPGPLHLEESAVGRVNGPLERGDMSRMKS